MSAVAVFSYTQSVVYVADNILKSLKDIIRLSGLDPTKLVNDWAVLLRGLSAWIESRHLENVTLEIFDPKTDGLLFRWDIEVVYLRLAIDAHATIAFAAGAVLDTKSGRIVEIVQRSPTRVVWSPNDRPPSPSWSTWVFEEEIVSLEGQGTACAVSITRDAAPMVRQYVAQKLPSFRRVLIARLNVASGQNVVECGAHANQLAESLADRLNSDRETNSALLMERVHLFVAAPNAFTFFLGRHAQILKPVTLYEFDFGRDRHGSYEPSLLYPDIERS